MKQRPEPTVNLRPDEVRRGDTGYARTDGLMGLLIRVGEWLKWRDGEHNHAFTVVTEGDSWESIEIVQATLRGVVKSSMAELLSSAIRVELLHNPGHVDPSMVAWFAERQVGDPYGLLSILCNALDILTPDWFIAFRRRGTWICSALAAESMRFGGLYVDWDDIYIPTPNRVHRAHLEALGAR